MDTFLNITLTYLFLGTLALPTVVLYEVILIQSKDMRFRDWLKRVLGEPGGGISSYKALTALLRWPMFVGLFVFARLQGKTLLEYIAEGIEKQKAQAEEVRRYTLAVLDSKIPIRRDWITFSPDLDFVVHFYRSHFMTDIIPTHLIVESDDNTYSAWRVISNDFERNLPLAASDDLKKLKHLCEADDVWLDVSPPCSESARERLWAEEVSRFEDEAELDKLVSEVIEKQDDSSREQS